MRVLRTRARPVPGLAVAARPVVVLQEPLPGVAVLHALKGRRLLRLPVLAIAAVDQPARPVVLMVALRDQVVLLRGVVAHRLVACHPVQVVEGKGTLIANC